MSEWKKYWEHSWQNNYPGEETSKSAHQKGFADAYILLGVKIKELENKLAATEPIIRKYAALEEALTASPDTKTEYIGEFSWKRSVAYDEDEHHIETLVVPWTTTKEIMKKIREYAEKCL